jgi:hypothetical protein
MKEQKESVDSEFWPDPEDMESDKEISDGDSDECIYTPSLSQCG